MRTLAEDAIGTLSGNLSSLYGLHFQQRLSLIFSRPAVEYRPPPRAVTLLPIFPNLTPRNLYHYALEHIQKAIPIFRPATVISPDPHAMALTGMFLDLKASIIDFDPLIFPFIFLSIPDSIQQSSYEACTRFQIAAQQAGLELLRPCTSASRSTLYYHYIGDCFEETDPDLSCRGDIKMPVTISYTSSSLAASRIRRHDGMLEIPHHSLDLNLGSESSLRKDQEEKYWASVKKSIEDVIGDEEVDALFLLGEHNKDPRFREVIKSIMQERGNGDRLGEITGLSRKDMGDGLWYGARGAAVVARRLMWHGGDSCLPNAWCEIASYHDEL
jgi:hypothetical protein